MKGLSCFLLSLLCLPLWSQGWPAGYGGVMLQGFYWDSYDDSRWNVLAGQADELSASFNLVWVPQSGRCAESYAVMGYTPYYYFDHNSSFGSEADLRAMITTFKSKGLGTMADVVVNHHNTTGWFSFPSESYGGQTYQLLSTDICANDDGGATAKQAAIEGVSLSPNNDEGEDWGGMRDLDHRSDNVQRVVKAYERFLVDDLGYVGFRYDMVKGFAASHVGDYNEAAGVAYSVGEYWDGNNRIEQWIDGTGKRSAAFDFQFRYNVRDAINNNDWRRLDSDNNLIHDAAYRRYAVTFVENHDTERRSSSAQDPITRDTLAANAYLLAMPGTPCVFLKHWLACKQDIKLMIEARRLAGITNESTYGVYASQPQYAARDVAGTQAHLLAVMGVEDMMAKPDASRWTKIITGKHYAYYLSRDLTTAWADKASGEYRNSFDVKLIAVSPDNDAQLVYTLDGTEPTANSTRVASGTTVHISGDCMLRVAVLAGGVVSGLMERTYTFDHFQPYPITVYVNTDNVGWTSVAYWTWGGDGSHAPQHTSWPGDNVTATETIDGKTWWKKDFTINAANDCVNLVVSTNGGKQQTVDITGINQTSFVTITNEQDAAGHYKTETTSDIHNLSVAGAEKKGWFTLGGQRLSGKPVKHGIYIHNGKKVSNE